MRHPQDISRKQPQKPMSSRPPLVLLLRGSDGGIQKVATVSGRAVRMSSSSLVTIFSVLSSSSATIVTIAFLLSFFRCLAAAASLSPVVPCLSLVLSSSSPFVLLLVCCLFGVVRSQLALLSSSWCVRLAFLCWPHLILAIVSSHDLDFGCWRLAGVSKQVCF